MDINTNNKFNTKCSTKTLVLKVLKKEGIICSPVLPSSYTNKLRNCVIKKIDKKCIKSYSNGTIQINGITDINCLSEILKYSDIQNLSENYYVECVLNNWTFSFIKEPDKIVDLTATMYNLNNNNIVAYFQRGYPLIIKYIENSETRKYIYNTETGNIQIINLGINPVKITIMLFKSGKCICTIGKDVCNLPLNVFQIINNYLITDIPNKIKIL